MNKLTKIINNDIAIKILISFIRKQDYKLKFIKFTTKKRRSWINLKTKQINIGYTELYYSKPYLLTFTMAHEVRHLLHMKKGLFKNYYSNNPYFIVGACAEKDCNKWASNYIKLAYNIDYNRKYNNKGIRGLSK